MCVLLCVDGVVGGVCWGELILGWLLVDNCLVLFF